jgi:hypothetical protein
MSAKSPPGLRLDEARVVASVLDMMTVQIGKRDRGLTGSHEQGRVAISLPTEEARKFVRAVERVLSSGESRAVTDAE